MSALRQIEQRDPMLPIGMVRIVAYQVCFSSKALRLRHYFIQS